MAEVKHKKTPKTTSAVTTEYGPDILFNSTSIKDVPATSTRISGTTGAGNMGTRLIIQEIEESSNATTMQIQENAESNANVEVYVNPIIRIAESNF